MWYIKRRFMIMNGAIITSMIICSARDFLMLFCSVSLVMVKIVKSFQIKQHVIMSIHENRNILELLISGVPSVSLSPWCDHATVDTQLAISRSGQPQNVMHQKSCITDVLQMDLLVSLPFVPDTLAVQCNACLSTVFPRYPRYLQSSQSGSVHKLDDFSVVYNDGVFLHAKWQQFILCNRLYSDTRKNCLVEPPVIDSTVSHLL